MIRPFDLSKLHEQYANETPDQRSDRLQANQERLERWVKSWKDFAEKHPDIANKMVCVA